MIELRVEIKVTGSQMAVLPDEAETWALGNPRAYVRHPLQDITVEEIRGHSAVPDGHVRVDLGEYGMLELSPRTAYNLSLGIASILNTQVDRRANPE